jgi:hypothetical protein
MLADTTKVFAFLSIAGIPTSLANKQTAMAQPLKCPYGEVNP